MKVQPFVLRPGDYSPALNVVGTKVTVLASNEATRGYEITFQQGDEGTGPPPHSHGWDESFFVVKGSVEFTCAGKTDLCTPGTLVHVPAGTVHGFRYGPEGGEMLEITGQGSQATQMFTAVDETTTPGAPEAEEIPKLVKVLEQNGVTLST
jgi:quercetin dioxygenase-like cupin family protein